jgi:hypothetical protein
MLGAIILTKDFNNKVIEKKNLTKSSITFWAIKKNKV